MNIQQPLLDPDQPSTPPDGTYSPFSLYTLIFEKLPRILGEVNNPCSFFTLVVLMTTPVLVISAINGDVRVYFGSVFLIFVSCVAVALPSIRWPEHLHSSKSPPDRGTAVAGYGSTAVTVTLKARSEFPKSFDRLLQDAAPQNVDISGLSLLATVTGHWDCFLKLAKDGCRFRFLLVEPESPILQTIMAGVENVEQPPVDIADDVRQSLRRLDHLISTENVEIRFSSFGPTCSLLSIESDCSQDMIQVELYGYGLSPSERPHFTLYPADFPWYGHYKEQFERLWEAARPLTQGAMPLHELEAGQDENA